MTPPRPSHPHTLRRRWARWVPLWLGVAMTVGCTAAPGDDSDDTGSDDTATDDAGGTHTGDTAVAHTGDTADTGDTGMCAPIDPTDGDELWRIVQLYLNVPYVPLEVTRAFQSSATADGTCPALTRDETIDEVQHRVWEGGCTSGDGTRFEGTVTLAENLSGPYREAYDMDEAGVHPSDGRRAFAFDGAALRDSVLPEGMCTEVNPQIGTTKSFTGTTSIEQDGSLRDVAIDELVFVICDHEDGLIHIWRGAVTETCRSTLDGRISILKEDQPTGSGLPREGGFDLEIDGVRVQADFSEEGPVEGCWYADVEGEDERVLFCGK